MLAKIKKILIVLVIIALVLLLVFIAINIIDATIYNPPRKASSYVEVHTSPQEGDSIIEANLNPS